MGPLRGIFQEPRGWTSRKKRSTSTEKVQRTKSYNHPIKGGMRGCVGMMSLRQFQNQNRS